jgi:hypothetical protein
MRCKVRCTCCTECVSRESGSLQGRHACRGRWRSPLSRCDYFRTSSPQKSSFPWRRRAEIAISSPARNATSRSHRKSALLSHRVQSCLVFPHAIALTCDTVSDAIGPATPESHGEHRFGDADVLAGGLTREQRGFRNKVFKRFRESIVVQRGIGDTGEKSSQCESTRSSTPA